MSSIFPEVVPHPDEPRVSGGLLLEQHRVLESIVGPEAIARGLASIPAEMREPYTSMLPVSWIPVSTVNAVILAIAREAGQPAVPLKVRLVREGTKRAINHAWRILLRFTSDEALTKRADTVYHRTYDRGTMVVKSIVGGHAEIEVSGWPMPMPQLDIEALAAGISTVLEYAGRKSVRASWQRISGGAKFDLRWA